MASTLLGIGGVVLRAILCVSCVGSLLCASACVPPGSPGTRLSIPGSEMIDPMDVAPGSDPGDPADPEGSGGSGGSAGSAGSVPTWWQDVEPILRAECSLCHGATPLYGAPMSLASYADVIASAWSDRSRSVHSVVVDRIRGIGGKPLMPPVANGSLSAAEVELIERWSAAGAPEGSRKTPEADAGSAVDGGDQSPPVIGGEDAGGAEPPVVNPEEPYSTIDVLAPMAAIRTGTDDLYGCFRTVVQVPVTSHAVEITPVIDQAAVVHHILLFRDRARTYPASKQGLLCAADTVGRNSFELLHGWAPGGEAMVLPPEAGVRISAGEYLVVQIHYNNPNGPAVIDASGMRLKLTASLRANDAAVTGIGTESFSLPAGQAAVSRSGSCTLGQGMHIISYSPHMHLLGRSARMELVRGNSAMVVADVPVFAFESQVSYPMGIDFQAGDVLRTTCTWDTSGRTGTTRFGEATGDEMCYMFVAHYPPIGEVSCTR